MGKLPIIILILCIIKCAFASEDEAQVQFEEEASSEDTTKKMYDTKFDNIDVEDLLKNDRLLKNYVKCLEYEGPCTPDGKMLRGKLVLDWNLYKNSLDLSFGRDSSKRIIDQLRQVFRDAEVRIREGYSLFDRRAKGILGGAGEDLWSRWILQECIFA